MGKANKGKGAAVVVAQATALATANGGTRGNWQGYTACGLLRAMGYAGYTAKQGYNMLAAVGLGGLSPTTAACQVGGGRQYANGVAKPHHTGSITPLAGAVLAQVVAAVGQPANPLAGKPAPLPAPKVPGVVAAPVPVVAPAKAAGKPAKAKGKGK